MIIGEYDKSFTDRELEDFYLKKGTNFNGFVLPDNFVGSKAELYNLYGLWDNLNGVGVVGNELKVFKSYQEIYYFLDRPYIGDFIIGVGFLTSFVLTATKEEYLWGIARYTFSESPPLPKNLIRKNDYSDKINKIIDLVLNFVDGITVIGAPTPQGPVSDESPAWLVNKAQIKQELNQLKQDLEEAKV